MAKMGRPKSEKPLDKRVTISMTSPACRDTCGNSNSFVY